ncbi:MAG: ABC transporter permease subunit [Actinomycetota bacterium]|nr:ABC transporter permease subunit [Actinomycetota bacterium]
MNNALKIFRKEIKEILKNRSIWAPTLIVSLVFSVFLPLALMLFFDFTDNPEIADFATKIFGTQADISTAMINFMVKQFTIFLLLIPAMVPSLIAPASIILEKDSRTLEPLLATPIKTSELLLGKTLTSMIPSFAISAINFVVLSININILAYIKAGIVPLPNLEWTVAVLILSPTISFIITILSIIFSSKATDIRSAQGIGSTIILPIYLIIGLQLAGLFLINYLYLLLGCLVLLLACPLLLRLAIKVFDREHILTRWKYK